MALYAAQLSARPNIQLHFHVNTAQNQAGNYSTVSWSLYLVEASNQASYSYDAAPWSVSIAGQGWSGAAPYDFRAGGLQSIHLGSGSRTIGHDANGYAYIDVGASFGGSTVVGTAWAGGGIHLPRIPKPPGAPLISGSVNGSLLGPQDIKTTSMVVKFSGTTDGGATITGWQLQYAEDAAFTIGAKTIDSWGTSTVTGLKPGKTYYFRARGINTVGPGPWSVTASAKTMTALYVSDGAAWTSVEVYVSDGSTWHLAELYLSDGSTWREPAA